MSISGNTHYHLQHEKLGTCNIEAYKKIRSEKPSTDGFIKLLMSYDTSPFRDFDSYLINVVGLNEDNLQLVLKQNNPNFVTYQISPGIYTNIDFSDVVYTVGDHDGTLNIEHDINRIINLPMQFVLIAQADTLLIKFFI